MSGEDAITRLRAANPQLHAHTLVHTTASDGTIRVVDADAGGYVITVTPAMQAGIERIEAFTAALNRATEDMAKALARLKEKGLQP